MGKQMIKRKDGSYSQRGLWDNIRANKGSGKKPTAEMLKQENADRVANSPDTEWDLIQELIITPSVFIIKSDSIMIELDNDLKITGRIKKRRKK